MVGGAAGSLGVVAAAGAGGGGQGAEGLLLDGVDEAPITGMSGEHDPALAGGFGDRAGAGVVLAAFRVGLALGGRPSPNSASIRAARITPRPGWLSRSQRPGAGQKPAATCSASLAVWRASSAMTATRACALAA